MFCNQKRQGQANVIGLPGAMRSRPLWILNATMTLQLKEKVDYRE